MPIGLARGELARVIECACFDLATSSGYQRLAEIVYIADCGLTSGVVCGGTRVDAQRSIPKPPREFVFTGVIPHVGCDKPSATNHAILLGERFIKCDEIQNEP